MQDVRACVCARIRIYSCFPHAPPVLACLCICTFAHFHFGERKSSTLPRPPAHRQTSTFARHRAQAAMSTARERKIARFFFARRNALAFSALRPFQEKFPKISPKFLRQKFGVCAKSPYLCTRKSEMRPTIPHKSEAIRSLKTLHKTIL